MKLQDLKNKKIAILGFGKEGESTLKFLKRLNCNDITILDKSDKIRVNYGEINLVLGENYNKNLDKYDIIFRSPGISPYENNLFKYKDKILTQAKLFYHLYKGKIISVTQTKGKSTTVALINELLLNSNYKTKLVGNIGKPIFDEIDLKDEKNNYDFVICELSSYMLEDLYNHHSFISIIGNIFKDHTDWHESFSNYKKAKLNILKNAKNILVGYKLSKTIKNDLEGKKYKTFGTEKSFYAHIGKHLLVNGVNLNIKVKPLILGKHNLANITGVLGLSYILKIPYSKFLETVNSFKGLPHRLEDIGIYNGINFIDDSISTTPESTIAALNTFGSKIDTVILGGTDRGYNFKFLIKTIFLHNIENIILFPDSGEKIFEELQNQQISNYKFSKLRNGKLFIRTTKLNIYKSSDDKKGYELDSDIAISKDKKSSFFVISCFKAKSMKEAIKFAYQFTTPGKICLLSTASPSYSLWKNFEEKGNEFKKYVESEA